MASTSGGTQEEQREAERAQKTLVEFAQNTKIDLYAKLSLTAPSFAPSDIDNDTANSVDAGPSFSEIRAAWRRAALRHHPDKNPGHEREASDKLEECRKAFEVLSNDVARQAYHARRRHEHEKAEREAKFEGRRRKMRDDLERRETAGSANIASVGTKRSVDGEEEVEQEKMARMAASNRARLEKRREEMRQKKQQEEKDGANGTGETNGKVHSMSENVATAKKQSDAHAERSDIARTLRVRWPRSHSLSEHLSNTTALQTLFSSSFGPLESNGVILLKDKRSHPRNLNNDKGATWEGGKKVLMAQAAITFMSITDAHAVVCDFALLSLAQQAQAKSKTQNTVVDTPMDQDIAAADDVDRKALLQALDDVEWADGHGPNLKQAEGRENGSANADGDPSTQSSSLWEVSMMRLKEAEHRKRRRKLEEVLAH